MKNTYKSTAQLAIRVVFLLFASVSAFAQNGVRIAGSAGTADPSAMLDVVSTNKGVLFPRVCLASLTANSSPVTNPQAGLVIYNTGLCGIAATGLYFWNGAAWVFLNTGGFSAAGVTNYHAKFTASNAIGSSIVYDDGTNVGIGTASPGAPLTILHESSYTFPNMGSAAKGAINIRMSTSNRESGITFSQAGSDNAQAGIFVHQDNSAGTHMYFATTDNYATGPQTRMTILNTGNVGIGTATPGAKLEVNGDLKISSGRLYGVGIASYAYARSQTGFTPPTSQSAAAGSANEIPGLVVTITTHGGDLEIEGTLFLSWGVVGGRGAFSASIDGVWVGNYIGWGASWGNWYDGIIGKYAGANWDTRTYHRIVNNVPAGTHTVKLLAWNETASGWSINCCSMASEMVVKELLKQN